MAKIFVRSADFSEHQLNVHLLRTHLLSEVFAVSLLRNMPMVHPLYKVAVKFRVNELADIKMILKLFPLLFLYVVIDVVVESTAVPQRYFPHG